LGEHVLFRDLIAEVDTEVPTAGREDVMSLYPPPRTIWFASDAPRIGSILGASVDLVPARIIYEFAPAFEKLLGSLSFSLAKIMCGLYSRCRNRSWRN